MQHGPTRLGRAPSPLETPRAQPTQKQRPAAGAYRFFLSAYMGVGPLAHWHQTRFPPLTFEFTGQFQLNLTEH